MSTPPSPELDALIDELGKVSELMRDISQTRGRIEGYRQERDRYAELAKTEKASLDALIGKSRAQLHALRDGIDTALPRETPTP